MLKNGVLEYSTIYLGNIINSKNDTLKFITTNVFNGNYEGSKSGDGIISIYSSKNQRIGYYYIGGAIKKPFKILNNSLYLPSQDSTCNQATTLIFKDSIPNKIFINCTEKGGDLYNFEEK
jgi:hypothetical protein